MADEQTQHMVMVRLSARGPMRTEQFMGRAFTVVPAVMVRSQVLHNNLGMSFLPPSAITADWASVWNGIPVLVGPHPTERGSPVSGRSPQLWNSRGAGWIFNAKAEQDSAAANTRLTGEVWLDQSRRDTVPGLSAVFAALTSGQPVELSTGFNCVATQEIGTFEGSAYELVLSPRGADHLVVSTEMTGACSVADGCGLGVNAQEKGMADEEKTGVQAVLARAAELLGARREAKRQAPWADNIALMLSRTAETLNAITPSDQDRWNMIRDALQRQFGTIDNTVCICDVYSTEGWVVFWFSTPFGPEPPGNEYYRVDFTTGDSGVYEFSQPVRVTRMTTYEPSPGTAGAASGGAAGYNAASKEGHNSAPCGCRETSTMENGKEGKEGAPASQAVNGLEQVLAAFEKMGTRLDGIETGVKASVKESIDAQNTKFDAAVAELTKQVAAVSAVANEERNLESEMLITELSTNERTPFSKEELTGKSIIELRKLAQLAKIDTTMYSGRGGPRPVATNAKEEQPFAASKPYWEKAATPAAAGSTSSKE